MTSAPLQQPMQTHPAKAFLRAGACAALILSGLIFAGPAFAQADANGLQPGQTKVENHSESLLDIWKNGGIVMYPLGFCSIMLIWLTVDVFLRTSGKSMAKPADMQQLQDLFRAGDYVGAYQFAKNNPTTGNNVVRVTLSYIGDGQDATEYAMADTLNKVNAGIQTRINYLSVIGVCTPMIGLVGTVSGMMKAFKNMGTSGIGDPSGLAKSIGEVLIATASGLFIAIPAFIMFYLLRNRLQVSMHNLQEELSALFRKMPYAHLKDCHVGEEEFFAAVPNWVAGGGAPATGEPAHA